MTPEKHINGEIAKTYMNSQFPVPRDFNSKEIRQMKRLVLAGDWREGEKLIGFYDNCLVRYEAGVSEGLPNKNSCKNDLDFWIEIDAVNGSAMAASRHFNNLIINKDCISVYRSRFWLKRIPEHQDEPWISEERRLKERERLCGW